MPTINLLIFPDNNLNTMKRFHYILPIAFFMIMPACLKAQPNADTLVYSKFGTVHIYKASPDIEEVVLFVSGDGGWNLGVIDMAVKLANHGALVVGIDINQYFKKLLADNSDCYYMSGDFEDLSRMVQKNYGIETYHTPILAGYSSGATLVYGLIAQAPDHTYKGALSIGFCPDLETKKPMCEGSGLKVKPLPKGYDLQPRTGITSVFVVLIGELDKVCNVAATEGFMSQLTNARLFKLPKVGHGFSVEKNWMPQFIEGYKHIVNSYAVSAR
jgi:hypothetical protein